MENLTKDDRELSLTGRRSEQGFTLPEIFIVVLISVFIILVMLTLLSAVKNSWYISQTQSDLYLNGRKAITHMVRELSECSSGRVETFTFYDPLTNGYAQGIWFASARGNPELPGEDGSPSNDYVHLNNSKVASWRGVAVYCIYETSEGIRQIRRYVDYGPSLTYYDTSGLLPLTFSSASSGSLVFTRADGSILTFDRAGGFVLGSYFESEDANNNNSLDANEDDGTQSLPADNADGVLDYGLNFSKSPGRVDIVLFQRKPVNSLREQGLNLTNTVKVTVKLRQP